MFTLARLWYLDCQTTFLYCHFFEGIPLGLQDQYLAVRIRFEPQKSILWSYYAKYTLLVRCVARWNHSTCFEAEIARTWQWISCHLRSLRVSNLHIVPWQNSSPWVGVGTFVSGASAKKKKKTNALKSHCWLYGKQITFVVYLFHTIEHVTKMLVFEI